jgi:hypothetical protein
MAANGVRVRRGRPTLVSAACEYTKKQQHTAINKKFRERGEEYLLIHDGLAPDP